ncbi:rhodanese-like domain-containing protein [Colletotrichum karsti]|uniref:M-phase inducer phosphatase n=1 Tax=Colletotrichum karsti TaxID=1095194 RepID=A0A9P6II65_9PEZI|nr:rhodanese-like domain-containing protein [Colletotrichum karsti]KAF9879685.1 rhodanese-like domain-containing protein [Colletotrichum karsti]
METSPLAAMHRPMAVPSWGNKDLFRPRPHYTGGSSLREQIHRSNDYFSIKDVHGSSPAASLAADLSQNFRLDCEASPKFPTPRRALFTSNMMGDGETREYVLTTPPLPESSPAPLNEMMDVSPLPHKMPFMAQIEITSPTPGSTPTGEDDEMMLDSPAPIPRQASLEPPKPLGVERRKPGLRRPSLTRTKGYSTSGVPGRSNTDNQLPTFRFGENRLTHMSSALSLDECFETTSPPQERRPQTANSPTPAVPGAIRSRPQFSSLSGNRSSPFGSQHNRRPNNPFMRPRKQFRRSLSMFEHPGDVVKSKSEGGDSSPTTPESHHGMDDEIQEPLLPHFLADDPTDTIPRITRETMVDLLDGKYSDKFDQKMVIDCRFEYEYEGGHIDGAVNYNSKDLLASQLFQHPMQGRTILIFHCEYSAHRAPMMARHVRSEDRTVNAEHYPHLTYPDVYILEGGYSAFFNEHRCRCYPQNYVEMSDEAHQRTCERELGRLKNPRKGFGRAQTFAFGEREPCVDQSPTAPSRPSLLRPSISFRQDPSTMIGNSPILGERCHARRMASY